MALECRWFFKGICDKAILDWFRDPATFGALPSGIDHRTDQYLLQAPRKRQFDPGAGLKLREGKLEVKIRLSRFPLRIAVPEVTGFVEEWRKTGFEYLEHDEQSLMNALCVTPADRWITVRKIRQQRRFSNTGGGPIESADFDSKNAEGGLVELTLLDVEGCDWWSVGLDAFSTGDAGAKEISGAAEWFFREFPRELSPSVGQSTGYPAWLIQVLDT